MTVPGEGQEEVTLWLCSWGFWPWRSLLWRCPPTGVGLDKTATTVWCGTFSCDRDTGFLSTFPPQLSAPAPFSGPPGASVTVSPLRNSSACSQGALSG